MHATVINNSVHRNNRKRSWKWYLSLQIKDRYRSERRQLNEVLGLPFIWLQHYNEVAIEARQNE